MRLLFQDIAVSIASDGGDPRATALALTHLEEASHWTNRTIAERHRRSAPSS
jgi:hypothetical protein